MKMRHLYDIVQLRGVGALSGSEAVALPAGLPAEWLAGEGSVGFLKSVSKPEASDYVVAVGAYLLAQTRYVGVNGA